MTEPAPTDDKDKSRVIDLGDQGKDEGKSKKLTGRPVPPPPHKLALMRAKKITAPGVTQNDRAYLSQIMAEMVCVSNLGERIRIIDSIISLTESYLSKDGKYFQNNNENTIDAVRALWSNALDLSAQQEGADNHTALELLSECEATIRIIIEVNGLSANIREDFRDLLT